MTVAETTREMLEGWLSEHKSPTRIHMTLKAAALLADETQPRLTDPDLIDSFRAHGADVSRLERMNDDARETGKARRESLSHVGVVGALWGIELEVHAAGPVDIWLT